MGLIFSKNFAKFKKGDPEPKLSSSTKSYLIGNGILVESEKKKETKK